MNPYALTAVYTVTAYPHDFTPEELVYEITNQVLLNTDFIKEVRQDPTHIEDALEELWLTFWANSTYDGSFATQEEADYKVAEHMSRTKPGDNPLPWRVIRVTKEMVKNALGRIVRGD